MAVVMYWTERFGVSNCLLLNTGYPVILTATLGYSRGQWGKRLVARHALRRFKSAL